MSGKRNLRVLSAAVVLVVVLSCLSLLAGAEKDEKEVRVIVLFKDKVDKDLVKKHGGSIIDEYTIIPGLVSELTQDEINELRKSAKVKSVDEDSTAEIMGEVDEDGKGKPSPPPPATDWGVSRINADDVWEIPNTGSGVKVAVLDTGIDLDHKDLGTVYSGWDFINNDANADDDNGHGTHCAGIIGALDDGNGVSGVAPGVTLYAVKVLDSKGSGPYSVIIDGIEWAVSNDMQVISMSLSGTYNSAALEAACDNARAEGIVIVAAAGNSGNTRAQYPAAYSSVISVGATDSTDARAKFSSYGSTLDLMAPGVNILSTYPNDRYAGMSGTSMACPHVSGTVALVLYAHSGWNPDQVQTCLQKTAYDLDSIGWDKYTGYGLVDALAAVS
ncbi:MAG: S8 family peptidase [Euryarchaeota archaeon]|nr:S8 family peptidase [Euryarchaeota archaeon]